MSPVLRAAVILLVLTSVCTLLLAGGNLLYEGVKAERQRTLRMAILDVFGEKFDDGSFDEVFRGLVTVEERPKDKATLFLYQGTPRQAALLVSGPGLWGVIEMLVYFDTDALRITRVNVISQAETPGLGGRIEEEWFLNQFRSLSYATPVRIVKQRTGDASEVDAIAGATNTSRSVEEIINRAAALVRNGEGAER